jgi:type IV pilus assembly protein PilO
MLKSRTSRWSAATAGLCLLILLATWFTLVSPRRSDAAALREQTTSTQQSNDLLQVRIAQLKAQYLELPARRAELTAVLSQLPAEAEVPTLIRQLSSMASASGMQIDGITPSAAQRSTAQTGTGTKTAASSAASASTGSPSTASGSLTLVRVPLSIVLSGDYFQVVAFLQQVQTRMKRALLITGISAQTGGQSAAGGSGQLQVTVTGELFVLSGVSADGLTSSAPSAGSTSSAGAPTAQPGLATVTSGGNQ